MRQGKMRNGSTVRIGIATLMLLIGTAGAKAGTTATTGGYLGVYTSDLDAAMLEALKFDEDGILVNEVIRDTPAEKAGLKAGDILMMVGDRKVLSTKSLKRALWRLDPGEETTIVYWRDNKKQTTKVTVAEKPERSKEMFGRHFSVGGDGDTWTWHSSTKKTAFLGVELESLGDQLGEYFGVKRGEGALIKKVVEDSPAQKAGLKAGDVILSVAGEEVDGPGDVSETIRDKEPGSEVDVVILREKKKKSIKATLAEHESNYHFNLGSIGYMVPDVAKNLPEIDIELDALKEELESLKVRVDELSD